MQPYFYIIRDKHNGILYAGSQYSKSANPADLLTKYFTSSKTIEHRTATDFEIVRVIVRNDARNYEGRWLRRVYRKLGRERFLAEFYNRNLAPGILNTAETMAKGNVGRKVNNRLAALKRVEDGTHNFLVGRTVSEEERQQRSERMKGNNYGATRNRTDEFRAKQAAGAKGNKNVRGYRWWTDGVTNRRAKECPGDNFYLGTTRTHESRNNKAESITT